MLYTYLGCKEGLGFVRQILKMDYYCRKSMTEVIEITTLLFLCLNAFQALI